MNASSAAIDELKDCGDAVSIARIPIDKIRTDGRTQSRAKIDEATIAKYDSYYRKGRALPALIVFFDGVDHWLVDGFHRLGALRRIEDRTEAACEIRNGTLAEARWFSLGVNDSLTRTNEDKRFAVRHAFAMLAEKNHDESDNWIAERCSVAQSFVSKIRRQLNSELSSVSRTAAGSVVKSYPDELEAVSSFQPATLQAPAASTVSSEPPPRMGKDGKVRRLPKKDPSSESNGKDSSGRKPTWRNPKAIEFDQKVRALHDEGRTTGEIMATLSAPRTTVSDSKARQGLTAMSANPLDSITTKVDAHASFLGATVETWNPKWDRASPEQRKELIRFLESQIKSATILIDRLKKEAVKKRSL